MGEVQEMTETIRTVSGNIFVDTGLANFPSANFPLCYASNLSSILLGLSVLGNLLLILNAENLVSDITIIFERTFLFVSFEKGYVTW